MLYNKIKNIIKKKFIKEEVPKLPVTIINEFVKDFGKETVHLKFFFEVYSHHHMRAKIEERMKLFERHHNNWKEVQKVAMAMVTLHETIKKTWIIKKQKNVVGKRKTNKQIYNMLFNLVKNKKMIEILAKNGELACEHGVKLQREYLYHITNPRIKKSFETTLVDAYNLWKEFTASVKEKEYVIE